MKATFLTTGLLAVSLAALLAVPSFASEPDEVQPLPATDIEIGKVTFYEVTEEQLQDIQQEAYISTLGRGTATGKLGEKLAFGAEKYAVVIGTDCSNNLGGAPKNAAMSMYNALTTLYEYKTENIHLLLDKQATFNAVYSAIRDTKAKANPGDEVVFFFAGHGTRGGERDSDDEAEDEGICCHDYIIWDGHLRDWFSDFATSRLIFIFDCCFAGGMNDLAEKGRIVVMSTEEDKVAYAYRVLPSFKSRLAFSLHFVSNAMLAALGDRYDHDRDGSYTYRDWMDHIHYGEGEDVAIEEGFDYAKEVLEKIWWFYQRPVISDSFEDDLIFGSHRTPFEPFERWPTPDVTAEVTDIIPIEPGATIGFEIGEVVPLPEPTLRIERLEAFEIPVRIVEAETPFIKIQLGSPATIQFDNVIVKGLTINTVEEGIPHAALRIRQLVDKPLNITAPPSHSVYRYFTISTDLEDSDVSSADIQFTVERAWIAESRVDESTIRLNRYDPAGEVWTPLLTEKTSEDDLYVYYSATLPGFSLFAITGEAARGAPIAVWLGVGLGIGTIIALLGYLLLVSKRSKVRLQK